MNTQHTEPRRVWLSYEDLQSRGIKFTRTHIRRLEAAGKFPARVKMGKHRIAWRLDAIEAWEASLCSEAA